REAVARRHVPVVPQPRGRDGRVGPMEPRQCRDPRPRPQPEAPSIMGVSMNTRADWHAVIARYQRSDVGHAIAQLATTLVPLATLFYVMYLSLALPYWTTLVLALPTAGLLVRTFIIMHD